MSRYFLFYCFIAYNIIFSSWIGSQPTQDSNPIGDLINWDQLKGKQKSLKWINSLRYRNIQISQECNLKEKQRLDSVHYIQIQCGSQIFDKLIHFQKSMLGDISSVRLERTHRFGNNYYIEISINSYNQQNAGKREKKFSSIAPQTNATFLRDTYGANPNLTYFKDMAKKQNLNDEIQPNLFIYFDRTCPLEYLGANHDFYWDDKIFHDFSISCLDQSLVSIVRIEANNLGELKVGNVLRKNINQGERFLAYMILKSWKNDKIQWRDIQLYPYEK
jgi:hypothetical protein